MKLTLTQQDGVAVLTAAGDVSTHDIDVLRAGLTKLMSSGKNQVLLELTDTEKIPPDMIREISKFDLLARELSGRVMLVGLEALRTRVIQFAQPPVIECFTDKAIAIQQIKAKPSQKTKASEPPAPSPAPAPTASPAASSSTPHSSRPEDVAKLKSEIRQRELTDATSLRKRISDLENENKLLMERLHKAMVAHQTPSTAVAQQAQVQALQAQLEGLLAQFRGDAPKGA